MQSNLQQPLKTPPPTGVPSWQIPQLTTPQPGGTITHGPNDWMNYLHAIGASQFSAQPQQMPGNLIQPTQAGNVQAITGQTPGMQPMQPPGQTAPGQVPGQMPGQLGPLNYLQQAQMPRKGLY